MNMISSFAAPSIAVGMAALVMAFPSPRDLFEAVSYKPEHRVVLSTGVPDVSEALQSVSGSLGDASRRAIEEGCLNDLANADRAKLDRCAFTVVEALAELSEYQEQPGQNARVHRLTEAGNTTERLRLAALEVCRAKWANSLHPFDPGASPACAVSDLVLASVED